MASISQAEPDAAQAAQPAAAPAAPAASKEEEDFINPFLATPEEPTAVENPTHEEAVEEPTQRVDLGNLNFDHDFDKNS